MVAKHGAEDQLHVEHEYREQSQREKSGAALVEFGARLLFDQRRPVKRTIETVMQKTSARGQRARWR